MRRQLIRIEDVADVRTLLVAYWRAARGKRTRRDVRAFASRLDANLAHLSRDIMNGTTSVGRSRRFTVHDPKRRVIHAPRFPERVLHHAIMVPLEPVLDRGLVDDTFACRRGKGSLAAVRRVQHHLRRFPWYVQVDVRRYFDSVDHDILLAQVARRVKGQPFLALLERVVRAHRTEPGRGLPIGALTSQHLANTYLGPLDRFLLEQPSVAALVRYIDDAIWWCRDREAARRTLALARDFAGDELRLTLKDQSQIQRSSLGLTFCGFRVLRGSLRLSLRRRRRYAQARRRWESAWAEGLIDATTLQRASDSALNITAHADAAAWRRGQLARVPAPDV